MAGAGVNDALERAEVRADRLQLKLDEERALSNALRRQLRESSASAQQVASQVRVLQGAPNAPDAPGGSIAGLQRTITQLRDKLDLEKKSANAAHADRQKLEQQLSSAGRERQKLLAAHQELRAEHQRTSTELERVRFALRETGNSHDEAVGQVSTLSLSRGRERSQMEKEIAELKEKLELERRRAANRATRAAAAEAALRRRSTGPCSSGSVAGSVAGSGGGSGGESAVGCVATRASGREGESSVGHCCTACAARRPGSSRVISPWRSPRARSPSRNANPPCGVLMTFATGPDRTAPPIGRLRSRL